MKDLYSPRFTFYHGTIAIAKREHLTKIDVQRIMFGDSRIMDCRCQDYVASCPEKCAGSTN